MLLTDPESELTYPVWQTWLEPMMPVHDKPAQQSAVVWQTSILPAQRYESWLSAVIFVILSENTPSQEGWPWRGWRKRERWGWRVALLVRVYLEWRKSKNTSSFIGFQSRGDATLDVWMMRIFSLASPCYSDMSELVRRVSERCSKETISDQM